MDKNSIYMLYHLWKLKQNLVKRDLYFKNKLFNHSTIDISFATGSLIRL